MAETRLQEAQRLYDLATYEWRLQRAEGGIVEEADEIERLKGARHRAMSPEGAVAMGRWQQRRAELAAAKDYAKWEVSHEQVRD